MSMKRTNFYPQGIYDYRRYIANESLCIKLLRRIRWNGKISCSRCKSTEIWRMCERNRVEYRCKKCRYHFSDISGTIFEKTKIPISKWFLAIGLWKLGISALQLSWAIGVTYVTAWKMLIAMRKAAAKDVLFTKLSGEIEIDDTYYGGKRKGKRGRGAAGKIPVVGLRQRNGKVKTIVVPELKAEVLRKIIREHVVPGSTIYTDDISFYEGLHLIEYKHELINKTFSFISAGEVHVQSIESAWAHTKPDLKARHHKLSPQYLQEYLAENDFKFNNRQYPDFIKLMLEKLVKFYPLSI